MQLIRFRIQGYVGYFRASVYYDMVVNALSFIYLAMMPDME